MAPVYSLAIGCIRWRLVGGVKIEELIGAGVEAVGTDCGLVLQTQDGVLRIESPFRFRPGNDVAAGWVDPEQLGGFDRALGGLVSCRVTDAVVDERASLRVTFDDGSVISVQPDPDYEAWQFSGLTGRLLVCLPGGGLADWSGG